MKLITMTDFVLDLSNNGYKEYEKIHKNGLFTSALKIWICNRSIDYARFLKQPLKLEMFVPCDEEGNVLEDPELTMQQGNGSVYYSASDEEFNNYYKAEEKIIFKGNIEIKRDKYKSIKREFVKLNSTINIYRKMEYWSGEVTVNYPYLIGKNIEDLIQHELELTNTALKQLGL